ncbi:MAG: hypothetical protein QM537_05115 [Candidatus Symbiobacter sp.]|nr:hypothetical protein [Candidatus Symbiobacter sp.]
MDIKTFDNATGPSVFFRALGHPLAAEKYAVLHARLRQMGKIALFDAERRWGDFAALCDLSGLNIVGIYGQRLEDVGTQCGAHKMQPLALLPQSGADVVLALDFGAERIERQLRPVMPHPQGHTQGHPQGRAAELITLDAIKLPDDMIGHPRHYLDPLNFAADFVLMREGGGWHTRMITANYWHSHGGRGVKLWLCLFDENGEILARWWQDLPDKAATIVIDSRDIAAKLGELRVATHTLPDPVTKSFVASRVEFCGSLFCHAVGARGHDVIKYALDIYHDNDRMAERDNGDGLVSCTHDANPFPADYYAGLPAPQNGERVLLWLQNCHPVAIAPDAMTLNRMGEDEAAMPIGVTIPPYGVAAIDLGKLFQAATWPQQYELHAARQVVRPRYEVITEAAEPAPQKYIAHMNVERVDLVADAALPGLIGAGKPLARGYLLPAPILPVAAFESWLLPTPMVRGEAANPLKLTLFAADGTELAQHQFGVLPRHHQALVGLSAMWHKLAAAANHEYGHCELAYDFSSDAAAAAGANGWLHGLFRYQARASGQFADTSFGAHLYNIPWSWKKEPQSYIGKPPGLSTRLFLRVDGNGRDSLCHLIYPSSGNIWHPHSTTDIILMDENGEVCATRHIAIAQNGSYFFRTHSLFNETERAAAGGRPQIFIRDVTCRLFGFHGLTTTAGGFAFDHMFGF